MNWGQILTVLPAGVCLFWAFFYALAGSRQSSFLVKELVFIFLGVFLVAPKSFLTLFTGTSLTPLIMHYLDRIRKDENPPFYKILWLIFPTLLLTSGIIFYILSPEGMSEDYKSILSSLFHTIIIVDHLVFYGYLIVHCIREGYRPFSRTFGFLFKGKPAMMSEIQYLLLGFGTIPFLMMIFPQFESLHGPVLPFLVSAVVFLSSYLSLIGPDREITKADLKNFIRFNYNRRNKTQVVEAMVLDMLPDVSTESLVKIRTRIDRMLPVDDRGSKSLAGRVLSSVDESWRNDPLFERFRREVIDKKLFLHPGLSLQYVADVLGTNKTYVSKMVNKAFNIGFPELLNILRVDYAQQLLLSSPDAKQSDVATASGFLSASSFNIIFKRIAGQPPKLWLASNNR